MLQPVQLGRHTITPLLLAPMAGISDAPFRALCRQFGAGLTFAEMITADQSLWHTTKSQLRLPRVDEPRPRAVQIAGSDPDQLAAAAQAQVALGADLLDINMGCPAKKVCRKAAGSALLRDEVLVGQILRAVVGAVKIPVTLKYRTGWSAKLKNAVTIARIAEQEGIAALTLHGRTREDRFKGEAEHETLAEVVQAVRLPVFANGDLNTPEKAAQVLADTGATGIMLGRPALGQPWIFAQMRAHLMHKPLPPPPQGESLLQLICDHLKALRETYGVFIGLRVARKHCGWYFDQLGRGHLKSAFNRLDCPEAQEAYLRQFLLTTEEST